MFLSQYLSEAGIKSGQGLTFGDIMGFQLGERYVVQTHIGRAYDISDLEDVLEIIQTEFMCAGEAMKFSYTKNFILRPPAISLWISTAYFGPDLRKLSISKREYYAARVHDIRTAVTMYNLTQSWPAGLLEELNGHNYA